MTCPLQQQDGSYLLGALSPEDRRAYEEHLTGCPSCATALAEVAGLPGLLGRVPPDAIDGGPQVPDDVLPSLLARVQAERWRSRRRVRIVAAALATAAAVVATVVLGAGAVTQHRQQPSVAFAQVGNVPINATATLRAKNWGTEVDLRCTYTGNLSWGTAPYSLVATDRSGHEEEIATWSVLPGKPVVLVASTSVQRVDLASLEVRLPTGRPVLRLHT